MNKQKPTITFKFDWKFVEPIPLAYWKSRLDVIGIFVAVDIPLDKEHVYNSAKILSQQLGNGTPEAPILTPKGMNYAIEQLQSENFKTNFDDNLNFADEEIDPNDFIPD